MDYNQTLKNMKNPLSAMFIIYNNLMKDELQNKRNNEDNEQIKNDYQLIVNLRNHSLELFDMCNSILKKI